MNSEDLEALKKIWIEEQYVQRKCLILEDPLWLREQIASEQLLVGGVDISFSKIDSNRAVATLAVVDMKSLEVVCIVSEPVQLTIPYIPTFLAYREVDSFEHLCAHVTQQYANCTPHVLMVDGNGTLHPRGFGCACLLGYRLNCPTIGVAKNLLETDTDKFHSQSSLGFKRSLANRRRETRENLTKCGDRLPIHDANGTVCGVALLNTNNSINPVYVSPGHLISLDTACEIVLKTSKFRTPEPTRLSDQISRQKIRQLDAEQIRLKDDSQSPRSCDLNEHGETNNPVD
ncbi:Endonuclease V [Fasciola hepatica]|uniref:Endonuclease V n=1 Tax=Fasciola hepatica TaxID=6192 RepID=A0A4E0S2X5_FASHE|nr:Endonuclease V [Fasciola hepatica]